MFHSSVVVVMPFGGSKTNALKQQKFLKLRSNKSKGGNVVVFKENLLQVFSSWIVLADFKRVSTGEVRKNRTYIKIARFSPAWGGPLLGL